MKRMKPRLESTSVGPNGHVWRPTGHREFLLELEHVRAASADNLLLYRGHRDGSWVLDSLFARNFKMAVFGFKPGEIPSDRAIASRSFALTIHSAFHFKFGVYSQPSADLFALSKEEPDIDAWFEYLKRLQQQPEEDAPILQGSNLLDWTMSPDVAMWFANHKRDRDGAVYIFDATAAGSIFVSKPYGAILEDMELQDWSKAAPGMPLLICPKKQIAHKRSTNQQARYIAQMDLRLPLEEIWMLSEAKSKESDQKLFLKIIVPRGTEVEFEKHTTALGITDDFLFC